MIKSKTVKDALAEGKKLRAELDKKAQEEARAQEKKKQEEADKKQAALKSEAEYCLSKIPNGLADAVANRKTTFTIMSCGSENHADFSKLCALIEPKLKKMGLEFKHTTSEYYVHISFDPDQGYDATAYNLEVIVPDEGK